MDNSTQILLSEAIQMLVSSLTQKRSVRSSEIEVERFINDVARVQLGVLTGVQNPNGQKERR